MSITDVVYMIGAYLIVCDHEINDLECRELDRLPTPSEDAIQQRALIFSDSEEKPKYQDLLQDLIWMNCSKKETTDIIEKLCRIALADGYLHSNKKVILSEVSSALEVGTEKLEEILEFVKERRESEDMSRDLSWQESLTATFENLFYEWLCLDGEAEEENYSELLSGVGFSKKIAEITKNGCIDLSIAKECVDRAINAISYIDSRIKDYICKLNAASRSTDKDMQQVLESVESLHKKVSDLLATSLKESMTALEKKNRNIKYFTIAFMGRTKAGKSTLHKVVTHQKNDDIGVGKLRTTRFNRSWYWENLRIVDTPGIGAPGGDKDTDIASTIIDEADLICYLVLNDSIQETEFDFLETIKERNKPLFILLNCKIGLDKGPKLNKFLKNPTDWRTCEGTKSLRGHIERIYDMLDGKYNMDAVKIIPLQLLAAAMYQRATEGEQKVLDSLPDGADVELLKEGSNIKEFIKEVKSTVFNSGSLKKSMSVLDGSAFHLNCCHTMLSEHSKELEDRKDSIQKKYESFQKFYTTELDRLKKDVADIFNGARQDLKTRASAFKDVEYENKNAGDKWASDSTVLAIQKRMSERINTRITDLLDKIKERVSEIQADLNFQGRFEADNKLEGDHIVNGRFIAQIAGVGVMGVLGVLAAANIWNPGGWVLAGIGLVISLFTGLFKSKKTKIKEAKERMFSQLEKLIEENIKKNLDTTLDKIRDILSKVNNQTEMIFGRFIQELGSLSDELKKASMPALLMENRLNSIEAARILEYIRPGKIYFDRDKTQEITDILPVERDWKKQEFIINRSCSAETGTEEAMASIVTQMNVKLK